MIKPYVESLSLQESWRAEDVYAECLYGHSVLYICTDGFVILKEMKDAYSEEKELFIWIAQSMNDDPRRSMIHEYSSELEQIAKQINAKKITFGSSRPGYERVLGEGWKMSRHFEKAVQHG